MLQLHPQMKLPLLLDARMKHQRNPEYRPAKKHRSHDTGSDDSEGMTVRDMFRALQVSITNGNTETMRHMTEQINASDARHIEHLHEAKAELRNEMKIRRCS